VNIVLEVEAGEAKKPSGHGGGEAEASPEDARIRDTTIGVLSSKHFNELLTEAGKTKLKSELKDELNKELEKMKVHNIYFTSFAMQ
jgi:flagellar FliL protein